jgi:hypothetical protein
MSRFTGPLTITQLDADYRTWRLEQELVYEVGAEGSGRIVRVHPQFETDGASVPRLLQFYLPTWGRYSRAAVIHDYLYAQLRPGGSPHPQAPSRQAADAVFLEALEVCGVSIVIRRIMWAAVRVFGYLALLRARKVAAAKGDPMPEVAPRPALDISRKRNSKPEADSTPTPTPTG